jgi:hypothetical protein
VALAEPTRNAPTPEEGGVDARLADVLDHLLGTLEGLPTNKPASLAADEQKVHPQRRRSYGRERVAGLFSSLHLQGHRFRHSERLPYSLPRRVVVWFAYGCIVVGVIVMFARVLPAG